jgi:hypothetical protein
MINYERVQRLMKRQLTGMWLKLVIGTIQEKLREDVVGEGLDGSKITHPFMSFLKIDPVGGFETTRHGFLRITQTSQNPVCNAKTSEHAIIRDINTLGS